MAEPTVPQAQVKQTVVEAVLSAVEDFNQYADNQHKIPTVLDGPLFGRNGVLNSLALVDFIVTVEEAIQERFDVSVNLADERAMAQRQNPFRTLQSLVDYAESLIRDDPNG